MHRRTKMPSRFIQRKKGRAANTWQCLLSAASISPQPDRLSDASKAASRRKAPTSHATRRTTSLSDEEKIAHSVSRANLRNHLALVSNMSKLCCDEKSSHTARKQRLWTNTTSGAGSNGYLQHSKKNCPHPKKRIKTSRWTASDDVHSESSATMFQKEKAVYARKVPTLLPWIPNKHPSRDTLMSAVSAKVGPLSFSRSPVAGTIRH